jgi:hypothetical protein
MPGPEIASCFDIARGDREPPAAFGDSPESCDNSASKTT